MLVIWNSTCILFWFKTKIIWNALIAPTVLFPQYSSAYGDSLPPVESSLAPHCSFCDHLTTEILYPIKALYPVVTSWRATLSTNVMHLKRSDSCSQRQTWEWKASCEQYCNSGCYLPSSLPCKYSMYCLEPIIRRGNLLHTKKWLGCFSAVPEGSESSVHNTNTNMEVIRRFIPSGVSSVPHAGAKPLSSGFKADVAKLNAP